MGSGSKHLFQVHLPFQLHQHEKEDKFRDIPKGCVAVMVGEGEEQERFVIPVMHINHPLFIQLLKESEEDEYYEEFHHMNGPINIPCHVEEFRYVEGIIDKDTYHHHLWCFKA